MLTIKQAERRIAECRAEKERLQDHLKRCERTMPLDEQVETKNRIKELCEAQGQAEVTRSILLEYKSLGRKPMYASQSEGILISPALTKLLKEEI